MAEIVITNNTEKSRWEAHRGEDFLGFLVYDIDGTTVDLPETRVFPEYEGQGVASTMAKQAMDMVRAMGSDYRVIPTCSYMEVWFRRHKDYADLLVK